MFAQNLLQLLCGYGVKTGEALAIFKFGHCFPSFHSIYVMKPPKGDICFSKSALSHKKKSNSPHLAMRWGLFDYLLAKEDWFL